MKSVITFRDYDTLTITLKWLIVTTALQASFIVIV